MKRLDMDGGAAGFCSWFHAPAQVTVGETSMDLNALIQAGYTADYGNLPTPIMASPLAATPV